MSLRRIFNYCMGIVRRNPFTVTGRLLFLGAIFCFAAVYDFSLVALFSYLVWLLIIAFVCGLLFRPKLALQAQRVNYQHVGNSFAIHVLCQNTGRFPAYDLTFQFTQPPEGIELDQPKVFVDVIEPGQSHAIEFRAKAVSRGEFETPSLQCTSHFPLGLFRFLSKYKLTLSWIIAPACQVLPELAAQLNASFQSSQAYGRQKSRSLEYIGSREFQPGVPVRRWDFSSWARMGKPAVREFSEGQSSLAVVLYDNSVRSHSDPLLESRLSCVAGAIETFMQHDTYVQLLPAESAQVASRLSSPGEKSREVREPCMKQLAREQGCRTPIAWEKTLSETLRCTNNEASILAVLSDEHAAGVVKSLCHQAGRHLITHIVHSEAPATGMRRVDEPHSEPMKDPSNQEGTRP